MCSDQESRKQRSSKSAVGPRRKAAVAGGADAAGPTRKAPQRAGKASGDVKTRSTEEETYRVHHEKATCWLNGSSYFYSLGVLWTRLCPTKRCTTHPVCVCFYISVKGLLSLWFMLTVLKLLHKIGTNRIGIIDTVHKSRKPGNEITYFADFCALR